MSIIFYQILFAIMSNKQATFGNQTTGMGIASSLREWKIYEYKEEEDIDAILLATDGVSEDLIPEKRAELVEYLKKQYASLSQKKRRIQLEQELQDWGTPNHLDDKTLLLIWKKPYNVLLRSLRKSFVGMLLLLIPIGLGFKFYSGPFDWWFNNYGVGIIYEIFWIALLFAFFPEHNLTKKIPLGVFSITSVLEFLQLWHPLIIERLRAYFLWRTLLGTTFGWWDFPHYAIGCVIGWLLIRWFIVFYHINSSH